MSRDPLEQAPPCPACGRATAWSDAVCTGCDEALADIDPTFTPDVVPFDAGMWSEEAVGKAWRRLERPERRIPFRQVATAAAVLVVIGLLSPLSASTLFHLLDGPAAQSTGSQVIPDVPTAALADRAISPRPLQGPVPVGQGHVGLAFEWEHAGTTWSWTFELDPALAEHYRSIDRGAFSDAYAAFVLDPGDDALIADLSQRLRETADARGWDDAGLAAFALSFVQSLPYAKDDVTAGFDEYPRYPVETLLDDGSDCEDTAILLASILQQLGLDVVLLSPPGHMAVGVHLPDRDPATADATHRGTPYWYAETTGAGWSLGAVPPAYEGDPLAVHGLEARPVLTRPEWEVRWDGDRYAVQATVRNVGVLPAHDVRLDAAFAAGPDEAWDQGDCDLGALAVGAAATCIVRLQAPPEGTESRLVVRAWATGLEPRASQSKPFTA